MKAIIVSGPRWAGVQRIVGRLEEAFSGNVQRAVYFTSRKPMNGEENRRHFNFLSRRSFASMVKQGEFIWVDRQLGISRSELAKSSHLVVGVAPKSAQQLREALTQKGVEALCIFVSAGSSGETESFDHVVRNKKGPESAAAKAILLSESFLKITATFIQT
ncbi:MAG: hypothetical protein HYY10_04035 [Candidatus Liptonbacteria bacterium]|nr:hypothetical protein [Candidatus Liptonbacteria bacterium]